MLNHGRLVHVEDYEKYIGREAIERILTKAKPLQGLHITHVNSTYYGGGVDVLLSSLTLLMNTLGIRTGWRVLQGAPDFFNITKKMHNALQGGEIRLTPRKKKIYEEIVYENAMRNHFENHDGVIVHDPQPLPLIEHYRDDKLFWIWRCHIDMTGAHGKLWQYLRRFVDQYDAAIFSLKEYAQKIRPPQFFFLPAIDPFTIKNRAMTEKQMQERLEHYKIPTDLPLVVQVSRFDRWKDSLGVIHAFKAARKKVDCTLVLIGNMATDDPEGHALYESLAKYREERIIISLDGDDSALINALQAKAAVVFQKSTREGFGLTVAEAMWKGTPVIGGDVGGIRAQIQNGKNGFLVSSVEEATERLLLLLQNKGLRATMGKSARETVRKKFLLSRYLEQYLDLLHALKQSSCRKGIGGGR